MDDDVDAAEALTNGVGHCPATFGSGYVGCYEETCIRKFIGPPASRGEDTRTRFAKARCYCLADPLGAARDENTFAIEFMWNAGEFLCGLHRSLSSRAVCIIRPANSTDVAASPRRALDTTQPEPATR